MSLPFWHTRREFVRAMAVGAGVVTAGCTTVAAGQPANQLSTADYRLGPADQLRVTVFNEPGLTGLFVVGSQGTVAYPLIGDVRAAGLTVSEFTASLKTALGQYLRSPSVSVEVANYRPFFILGEVQRPGTYPYAVDLTVLNAVATAGGFSYRANEHRVFIRHANESEEHAYNLTVSTPVLPGDTIRVGERLF